MDVTLLPSDEITAQDRFQDAIVNADHCLNWKSVNLGHLSETINDVALAAMARSTPQLELIDLTYCESITEAGLINFIGRVPELSEIVLRRCSESTTDAVLNRLAICCRRLCTLDVSFCHRITDHGIASSTAKKHNLQRLSLYGCNLITNDAIATLANNCPTLQHLNISKCSQLNDRAILSLANGTYPPSMLRGDNNNPYISFAKLTLLIAYSNPSLPIYIFPSITSTLAPFTCPSHSRYRSFPCCFRPGSHRPCRSDLRHHCDSIGILP